MFTTLLLLVVQYLNSNHSIYKAVLKAEQEGNSLTEEGKRAARFLRMDLENGGIHLSPGALPIKKMVSFLQMLLLSMPKHTCLTYRKTGSSESAQYGDCSVV